MKKRKTKRNAGRSQTSRDFQVSKDPMVRSAGDRPLSPVSDLMGFTGASRQPFLFAIARDARTIFASWNIDWRLVFQTAMPADRQVHLRVIGKDGTIETAVIVEPTSAVHFLTISGFHNVYHVEIGYFQPIDTWHSVARSDEVEMPLQGHVDLADADLVTIPFHLRFQQISDLFGAANDTPLARVISGFQKRVLSNMKPNETKRSDIEILRNLNLSISEMGAAERDFKRVDPEKLARHPRSTFRFNATSPMGGL
jgi:hypothetical protein